MQTVQDKGKAWSRKKKKHRKSNPAIETRKYLDVSCGTSSQ